MFPLYFQVLFIIITIKCLSIQIISSFSLLQQFFHHSIRTKTSNVIQLFHTTYDDNDNNRQHDDHLYKLIDHDNFMQIALEEAKLALIEDEVPIGAVIVLFHETMNPNNNNNTTIINYEILSRQHNRVEQNYDASAHAEMLAFQDAGKKQKNWRLSYTPKQNDNNITTNNIDDHTIISATVWLYCTMEPCVMCYSSAQLFRMNYIVFGTYDHRLGAIYSPVRVIYSNDIKHPFHTITSITQIQNSTIQKECSTIIQDFFRMKRLQQKQKEKIEEQQ